MACSASIGGFRRGGVRPCGIISPLKVGVVTTKQQGAVRSIRVNIKYSQTAAASSVSSSAASLYKVLSVSPDASAGDVKSAYRRMALRYHPDVCPPEEKEECTRMFLQLQAAYETLSDPLSRQDYDWRLHNNLDLSGGLGSSGMNNSAWELQMVELMRRSNSKREYTWGGRMRSRNQQTDAAASAC